MHAFWEGLLCDVQAWALETLAADIQTELEARRLITGSAARELFQEYQATGFAAAGSPGLCAIAIDPETAKQVAATRLNQPVEELSGGSPLLVKLMWELPASALWRRIAARLPDHDASLPAEPVSDFTAAKGGFEPNHKYLQVSVRFMQGETLSIVSILLEPEFVLRMARSSGAELAEDGPLVRTPHKVLRESVRASAITLDAVMERLTMTIGECSRLEVGQIVPLPGVDPSNLALSSETINGSVDIGIGEMGVWKRQRALKLKTPVSKSFVREIADL